MFDDCTALTKVIIPSTITDIDRESLFKCSAMKTLIIKAVKPPTLSNNSFGYGFPNTCNIYVPDESVEEYKMTYSNYSKQIYPLSSLLTE